MHTLSAALEPYTFITKVHDSLKQDIEDQKDWAVCLNLKFYYGVSDISMTYVVNISRTL